MFASAATEAEAARLAMGAGARKHGSRGRGGDAHSNCGMVPMQTRTFSESLASVPRPDCHL